jgi:hypothetical protein
VDLENFCFCDSSFIIKSVKEKTGKAAIKGGFRKFLFL